MMGEFKKLLKQNFLFEFDFGNLVSQILFKGH